MKHFDLENFGKRETQRVTLAANILQLVGDHGEAEITINGFTKRITFDTDLTTTAQKFADDNYEYYLKHGFLVTADAGLIIALPRYGWESPNRINISIETIPVAYPTTSLITTTMAGTTWAPGVELTGVLLSMLAIDFAKAKLWRVAVDKQVLVINPVNPKDGDHIYIEITGNGNNINWGTKWSFAGDISYSQTGVAFTAVEGVYDAEADLVICELIDLQGTGGSTTTAAPLTGADILADPFVVVPFADPLEIDATDHKDFICYITDDTVVNLNNSSDGDAGMIELIMFGLTTTFLTTPAPLVVTLGTMFVKDISGNALVVDPYADNFISWRNVGGVIVYSISQVV
jgi:hypothetical protein